MRFSLKRTTYILVGTIIIISSYFIFSTRYPALVAIYHNLVLHDRFDKASFRLVDQQVKQNLHYSNYLFSGYHNFTKIYKDDLDTIRSLPLTERCNSFFTQFNKDNPDWRFSQWLDEQQFDKGIVNKNQFFDVQYQFVKDRKSQHGESEPDKITRSDKIDINKLFKERARNTQVVQQGMADTTTLIRLYGKCFLHNQDANINRDTFRSYTSKLFPFINRFSLPSFQRVGRSLIEGDETGESQDTLPANTFPIYNESNVYTEKNDYYDSDNHDIVDFIHKKSTGRGIVISASTKHARDIIKLIRVLRALNNRLPIQIVYKGDINKKSKELIQYAATRDIDFLLNPGMASEHTDFLPELKLMEQYREYGSEFPIQDVWFVNIIHTVERNYKPAFVTFSNKVLALMLNSFREVILLDADTVPLVPITEFFESDEYKKSGTFFFKDRSLRDTNDFVETNFFTSLFPTNEISLDSLFGIPTVTEKTLSNKYLTGWRHFQEAGVVVINKHDHFIGILMTYPLVLWREPVKSSIWGDKEMYWLGLAMAGDENYEFNEYSAASVGELTKNNEHTYYPNTESQELCSTHPGHVDKNGKLLWINSGFSYCKKNGHYRDTGKFPFSIFDVEDLKNMYANPLKVRAAVVPPDLPNYREPFSPIDIEKETSFKESWNYRLPDTDEINNKLPKDQVPYDRIEEHGPQKGWIKNGICSGYYYCAYNVITSYEHPGKFDRGHVFEFEEEQTRIFDYLSKIWVTGNTRVTPRTPPKPVEPVIESSTVSPSHPESPTTSTSLLQSQIEKTTTALSSELPPTPTSPLFPEGILQSTKSIPRERGQINSAIETPQSKESDLSGAVDMEDPVSSSAPLSPAAMKALSPDALKQLQFEQKAGQLKRKPVLSVAMEVTKEIFQDIIFTPANGREKSKPDTELADSIEYL